MPLQAQTRDPQFHPNEVSSSLTFSASLVATEYLRPMGALPANALLSTTTNRGLLPKK
jgi:hypothetical protein